MRLITAAGAAIDRIKINALSREERHGRAVWIKRRRWTAAPIMSVANRFFRLAGNPVQALGAVAAWRHWEVDCFQRLHRGEFRAFTEGDWAVVADEVPGRSLCFYLQQGPLSAAMLAAAGRELCRAHDLRCPQFAGPWSHGDPHSGNFVYEAAADRARLIDFEVRHDTGLPPEHRHADDLLVFLQDLVGRIPEMDWLPSAHAFLAAYGRPKIVAHLRGKLLVPAGIGRVWWAVRTTYLARVELERRIEALRASL